MILKFRFDFKILEFIEILSSVVKFNERINCKGKSLIDWF
jgi:hypothetical protein